MAAELGVYRTGPLSPETWDDFADLVEVNNGVWGALVTVGSPCGAG